MKKMFSLLALAALASTGCVDLPAHIARTQSVGGLPPMIDPKLPATDSAKKDARTTAEASPKETVRPAAVQEAVSLATKTPRTPAPVPVQPEEVTQTNAHEIARRLEAELDHTANEEALLETTPEVDR